MCSVFFLPFADFVQLSLPFYELSAFVYYDRCEKFLDFERSEEGGGVNRQPVWMGGGGRRG